MKSNQLLLSIIVTTMDPKIYLSNLFDSFKYLNLSFIEIIIVNQGEVSVAETFQTNIKFLEINPEIHLSAPSARNYGAKHAKGIFLWFLDDDCFIIPLKNNLIDLNNILDLKKNTVHILNRGLFLDGNFTSTNPNYTPSKFTPLNLPKYYVEWNIILPKKYFNEVNGFIEIGPGVNNAAQCGEITALVFNLISHQLKFKYCKSIKISHPTSPQSQSLFRTLGYKYGAGYSVGYSLKYLSLFYKLIIIPSYILRQFVYMIKFKILYIIFKQEKNKKQIITNKVTLIGFIDGLIKKKPRLKEYLLKFNHRISNIHL